MEKKSMDWENIGFSYIETDKRYVANYKDGKWDDGALIDDANITMNECAGVLQYAQTIFEGMKAYTEDGRIVTFRPDLNAARMADSAKRLEMPVFPEERFVEAVVETVKANEAYVPPYGSGATLYIRPYMFGINPSISSVCSRLQWARTSKAAQSRLPSVCLILTGRLRTGQDILRRDLITQ